MNSKDRRVNALEAAAEKAELTGQIRSFMTWLGEDHLRSRPGGRTRIRGRDKGTTRRRDEMLEWIDEDFDPSHFGLAAAKAAVAAV
jgi:hypothetical protein